MNHFKKSNNPFQITSFAERFQDPYQANQVAAFLKNLGHREVGGCTEIRIILNNPRLNNRYVGKTVSGYYIDYDQAAKDIEHYDRHGSVYCTLQPCDQILLRRARNRLIENVQDTTSDNQIITYKWILLDLDPIRPAQTSSSDQELQLSTDLLFRIDQELFSKLGVSIHRGLSGNGIHGLIPIKTQLSIGETHGLVKEILGMLAEKYSNDQIAVDTSVSNPSRITKVLGTKAIKGDDIEEAPHRRSIWLASIDTPLPIFDIVELHKSIGRKLKSTFLTKQLESVPEEVELKDFLSQHNLITAYVKEKEEGQYFTLEQCPFNSEHKKDSAVIQYKDGGIGFKCFHDSCSDKGWSDVASKLGIKEMTNKSAQVWDSKLPTIIVNNRPLPSVSADVLQAITNSKPPSLFHMGNDLVRVVVNANQHPILEEYNRDSLKGIMARSANFVRRTEKGDKAVFPSNEVAADILSLPCYPSLPTLKGILSYPLIKSNGQIVTMDGYDSETHYIHNHDQEWSSLADPVTPAEVKESKSNLAEVLHDFRFKDPASWANCLSLMLSPFIKLLVEGSTPGFAISAPIVGTGKTLLAKAIATITLGSEPPVVPEVESEAEQRKQIGALLQTAPIYVLIDNIKKPLSSSSLAAVLTTGYWQDRKLGSSTMLTLKSEAIWVFIGNNLQADPDLSRRLVMIQLNTAMERPWERKDFRHTDLIGWVRTNRMLLVKSCLTLVKNWIQHGKPSGSMQFGSYEPWSAAMSGILELAGVEGFMANREFLDRDLNQEVEAWSSFITHWAEEFQGQAIGVSDLFPLACSADNPTDGDRPLDQVLGPGSAQKLKIKLGKFLVERRNQIINGFQVTDAGYRKRAKQWQLVSVKDDSPNPPLHPPIDSRQPESVKIIQSQENHLSTGPQSESVESGESAEQLEKNYQLEQEIPLDQLNNTSVDQRLTDSPRAISTGRQTNKNKDLELGELCSGRSSTTRLSSVDQLNSAGGYPPTDYHLAKDEEEITDLLDNYLGAKVLGLDIETTGLDPLTDQIRLVQIAAKDLPVLILDLFQCSNGLLALTPLLENKSVKVIHNAKFELKFLLQNGIELKGQIFDSMLADKLLQAGRREHSSTLEHLVRFYLKRPLDKEQQNSNWNGDLTAGQLAYAAIDAQILLPLREKLISRLKSEKLIEVAQLEFDCVWTIAQMELAGIRLEVDRWQNYCQLIQKNIGQYQARLQRHFAEWSQKEGKSINLQSTQQLQAALASLGIQVKSTKKSTLETKSDSVVVADLLQYKHWQSQDSRYATKILESIHPQTNRIHAEYHQLGTKTGRLSCSNPPLQQIPTQPQVRSCFVPTEGNKFIIADYSQIELRVAAQISQDQRMIEAYQQGEDLHRLTASLLTGTSTIEVTDEQRQAAKAVNFGLLFAMGAKGLRSYALDTYGVEMSLERANQFKQCFFDNYAGFAAFLQNSTSRKVKRLRTLSGRIRYFTRGYASLPNALNTPIQGTAADIIKQALADLPTKLSDTKAQIVACIHDEIIIEVEMEQAETAKMILEKVMVKAGKHYLTDVPIVVEATIADSWAGK